MNKVFMTALLALVIAAPAFAHEGGHHVKGVIKELSPEKIVLTEATGKDVAFVVTKATEFFREGKPVKREDAKLGERAVVHGVAGGGTTAAEVMLGAAPAAH
jgi:isopropylmalate/homocitrate/citramalate synthase